MFLNSQTVKVKVGNKYIGGDAPITVQSMLCAPAHSVEKNIEQAKSLEASGCDIVRISVPDKQTLKTLYAVKILLPQNNSVINRKQTCRDKR